MPAILTEKYGWVRMATNGQKQVIQGVIMPRFLISRQDKILSAIYCEQIPASLLSKSYAVQ